MRALRNRQRSGGGRLSFRARLAGVVAVGVALRLVHVLAIAPSTAIFTDGYFFHWVGRAIAEGHGYVNPTELFFKGHSVATATHPPLYTLVVAAATKLGITGDEAQRSLGCLFGAGTIAVVGLVGRRVAGEAVGLLAAAIAACYPLLIAADGALMSETLYGLVIALVLLVAYRLRDEPTVWRAIALGAVIGLAALTRAEALLLLVLLVPAIGRLRLFAAACLAALVVLAPWMVRNWTTFDRPVLISTNDGVTLAGANCGATYHGRDLGSFTTSCIKPARQGGNEAEQAAEYRSEAASYAGDHAARVPVVVAVRVLRLWGLYQPTRLAYDAQNRRLAVQEVGVLFSYVLIPFAVFGGVMLRRRREPLSILLAPILLVTVTAALTYGGLRLRHAAEIPLVVLAAVGAAALWERRRRRRPHHAREVCPRIEG